MSDDAYFERAAFMAAYNYLVTTAPNLWEPERAWQDYLASKPPRAKVTPLRATVGAVSTPKTEDKNNGAG
jgi:hypothetical protein